MAPGNWVDLVEKGGNLAEKNIAVERDVDILSSIMPDNIKVDGVGYFCTHYPAFDNAIRLRFSENGRSHERTEFIAQGPIMAQVFEQRAKSSELPLRATPISQEMLQTLVKKAKANIIISGNNVEPTKRWHAQYSLMMNSQELSKAK